MAKALGADIIDFYNNGWPDGWYHDDNSIDVEDNGEGLDIVQPDQQYDLDDLGVLVKDNDPMGATPDMSFSTAFNRWKKDRDVDTIVVLVPKDKAKDFRAEMKTRGLKVN